jgi:hypothetical protein
MLHWRPSLGAPFFLDAPFFSRRTLSRRALFARLSPSFKIYLEDGPFFSVSCKLYTGLHRIPFQHDIYPYLRRSRHLSQVTVFRHRKLQIMNDGTRVSTTMSNLNFDLYVLHERPTGPADATLSPSDDTSVFDPEFCIDPRLLELELPHMQGLGTHAGQDVLSTSCLAG